MEMVVYIGNEVLIDQNLQKFIGVQLSSFSKLSSSRTTDLNSSIKVRIDGDFFSIVPWVENFLTVSLRLVS